MIKASKRKVRKVRVVGFKMSMRATEVQHFVFLLSSSPTLRALKNSSVTSFEPPLAFTFALN